MKTIPLTQGKFALVDDADYDAVNQFKWHVRKKGRKGDAFYAARTVRKLDGKRTALYLHQFLLPGHPQIDHRDGNGLNNQRLNLRPATNKQNNRGFKRKMTDTSSKFRGVCWYKGWLARIRVDGKLIYLGTFKTEEAAARAYDAAALRYFGEFASPNFP